MRKNFWIWTLTTTLAVGWIPTGGWAQTPTTCNVRDPDLQGTYEGDCVGGTASGKGRAAGKDQYEGGFRDGKITGYGVYTRANGQRVEGEFLDGKVHGRAKIYYPNGDSLTGAFEAGKLSGTGKLIRKSGETADVELRDGKITLISGSSNAGLQPAPSLAGKESVFPDVKWSPRLDLDDIFPSYILANATRKEPAGQISTKVPRGDSLSILNAILQASGGSIGGSSPSSGAKYLGDHWGLVGVALRTTESNTDVVVTIGIDEVAEPTDVRFKLDAPGDYLLYPKLKYKYDKLRTVMQPTPVNITWKLTVNGKVIGNRMQTATLRSIYDAPIQAHTASGAKDLSLVFAAYVTEDAPWIDKLLQDTLQRRFIRQFVGYQGGPQEAHRQVEAIYNELQRSGVRYSSITTSSQVSKRVSSQVVRFPLDSIRNAQANCIDGTVLMASVLRKIGLDAYIILGPGHAMLGYSASGNPQQGLTVVETTMLGNARFGDAVRAGNSRFADWLANHSQDGRVNVIRVADARMQGVMPIPR